MSDSDEQQETVKPSEQRGGSTPGADEAPDQGLVPAELGGSDAPREMLGQDPELGSAVLGTTTGSDQPATETGVDPSGGDNADAVSDGGPKTPPGVEPDVRDAAAGPRQVDLESAGES
jgi:hypothetical protein